MHQLLLSTGYKTWLNMQRCPLVTKHSLKSIAVGRVMNMLSINVAKYGPSISYCTCICKVGCNIGMLCTLYRFICRDWSTKGTVKMSIK